MNQDNSGPVPADQIVVTGPGTHSDNPGDSEQPSEAHETVSEPGKVMRIGSMIKQLLEEVRQAPLDDKSRARLRTIFERSVLELGAALSPDLRRELAALALPFDNEEVPSDSELRIAQAQLVGWLEGLFHGIQATLFAQQMAAQAQLDQMRQRGLPPGATVQSDGGGAGPPAGAPGGTYL